MKLTGALLSIMQLVAALVPHAKTSASGLWDDGGKTIHEVAFRGGIGFGVNEDEFLVSTFAHELEQVRKEISRILFLIIPPNILTEPMRAAIVNMDKVVLYVWNDNDDKVEDGSLMVTVNGCELELDVKEEYEIESFPKMHWESLISTLSNFNRSVMTVRGPCYKTTE